MQSESYFRKINAQNRSISPAINTRYANQHANRLETNDQIIKFLNQKPGIMGSKTVSSLEFEEFEESDNECEIQRELHET